MKKVDLIKKRKKSKVMKMNEADRLAFECEKIKGDPLDRKQMKRKKKKGRK